MYSGMLKVFGVCSAGDISIISSYIDAATVPTNL